MIRYIPREKLSKKARKKLDNQNRLIWPVPPVAKTFASRKDYSRKRKSRDYQDEWNRGIFLRDKDNGHREAMLRDVRNAQIG